LVGFIIWLININARRNDLVKPIIANRQLLIQQTPVLPRAYYISNIG